MKNGVKNEGLYVEIEGQSTMLLKSETWSKRDEAGQVVGSWSQFPLVLF